MNTHAVPAPGTRQLGVTSTETIVEVPEYVTDCVRGPLVPTACIWLQH